MTIEQLNGLNEGDIVQFPMGFKSTADAWEEINGSYSLSMVRAKIMRIDGDDRPFGVHLYHNDEFIENPRGTYDCYWYTRSMMQEATVVALSDLSILRQCNRVKYDLESFGEPVVTNWTGERGNHYISFRGYTGGYIHHDGYIRSITRNVDSEYNGFFSDMNAVNKALELFELNVRFDGTPVITFSPIQGDAERQYFISFGSTTAYLHWDGSAKFGAENDLTSAWYASRWEAESVVNKYLEKQTNYRRENTPTLTLGETMVSWDISSEIERSIRNGGFGNFTDHVASPTFTQAVNFVTTEEAEKAEPPKPEKVLHDYYVTFTADMLKDYNVPNPEKVMIDMLEYTEDMVRQRLADEFGEGRVCFAIYERDKAKRLLINELDYSAFSLNYIHELKKPEVPDNYTKRLVIDCDFAKSLINLEYNFTKIFCNGTKVVGEDYYIVDATNAYNTTTEKAIKQEGHKILSNKQDLRLGRVIKAFAGHLFTDLDIEGIVSKFKVEYEVDTSIVQRSSNVSEVYGISEVGGSCMAKKPSDWFDIYEDMKSEMAYITTNNGYLRARALIHHVVDCETGDEYEVLDRIFYEDEKAKLTMQQWRKEQGEMTRMSYHIDILFRGKYPVKSEYDYVPYIDNLSYAQYIKGEVYLCNSDGYGEDYDQLQETEGNSCRNRIATGDGCNTYCVDTGNYIHEENAYYCETDENHYEYDDNLTYIDGKGWLHNDKDDDLAYDEADGRYRLLEDLKYCESENIYTSSDWYIYVENGDREGSYEPEDECTNTEDVGIVLDHQATYIEDMDYHLYNTDDCFEHDDGKWYSYEEELEEDEDTEEVA